MFVHIKSLQTLALPSAALAVAMLFGAPLSYAGGKADHHHDAKGAMPHGQAGHSMAGMAGGQPGKASEVTRTIVITAKDTVFNLKSIEVKADETIRFVIDNKGQLLHEFTIGTADMQKQHQAEMLKMTMAGKILADRVVGDFRHAHGNSVMIEPKKKKEIIWKFAKNATLEFGCNLPGHYETGMKGKFLFKS